MNRPLFPNIEGLTVAITGANRGLGRALALAFNAAGAQLILHARSAPSLEPVAAACTSRPVTVIGDLEDEDLGDRLAGAAVGAYGGLDVLILSAAALGPMTTLLETPSDVFGAVMRVNVDAQLRLSQAVTPVMQAQGKGLQLWLTSGLGRFALPGYGVYCASKHALEGLMKTVAVEHGDEGVLSVAIAPGMVQTEMLKKAQGGADISMYQTPEETADAFVRMVGDLSPEHSGASLDISTWLG